MKSALKFIAIGLVNIAILLLLVLLINLYYAARQDQSVHPNRGAPDKRASLPSYEDHAKARLIFDEFHSLDTAFVPYAGWSRLPYTGRYTTVGAEGDRVHPHASASFSAEAHFFGGSTMWGSGAVDAETIPAHFERLLPHYRAFNHGESGFVSRQNLTRLIEVYRRGGQPALVVFYDGVNDVDHNCRPENGPFGHARIEQMRFRIEMPRIAYALVGSILEKHRGAARKLWPERFARSQRALQCHESPEYVEEVVDGLISAWTLAKQLVEANGGRFIGVLQPTAYAGSARIDHLNIGRAVTRSANMKKIYPLLQKRVTEMRANGETWITDFTDSFDGDRYLFVDYCHANGEGNLVVAKRLARLVSDRLPSD